MQDEIDDVNKLTKDLEKKIDGLEAEIEGAKKLGEKEEVLALRAELQQLRAELQQLRANRLGWPFQLKTFQFVLLSIVAELHHPLLLKFLVGGAEEVQEA